MEQLPGSDYHSDVDLEDFRQFVSTLMHIEGKRFVDRDHAFYIWAIERYEHLQDIDDGVSLLDIYEKNVIENRMEKRDFYSYCDKHKFPAPGPTVSGEDFHMWEFTKYMNEIILARKQEYKDWAETHQVDIRPKATTIFIDTAGEKQAVKTQFEDCAEIAKIFPAQ